MFTLSAQAQWGAWGAWGEDISSNTKNRNESLSMAQVVPGKVIGVRKVHVTPSDSTRTTNAAIGSIAGIAIAGQLENSEIARLAGGLGGAFVAQGLTSTELAHEVLVSYFSPRYKKTKVIAITTKEAFSKNESVWLIQDTGGTRIARY